MKMYIKIAVLLLVGSIIGMQNAAANCSDGYSGSYHSLFKAYVTHPCPNQNTHAEYNLYGDSTGDFDLYVMDTWDNSWYKSTTAGSSETLRVPIHCSYPHLVYVWTYGHSGNWQVCSSQVTWGEGFLDMGTSASAPDIRWPGGSGGEREDADKWILQWDWGCNGSPDEGELNLRTDGTLYDELHKTGRWTRTGDRIHITWDTGPAVFDGTVANNLMTGFMTKGEGTESTGCWSARKANA